MRDAPRPLLVFERDSIESYLLDPAVIARVITEVADERGREIQISIDDVTRLLMEATDELKLSTLDRAAERYVDFYRRTEGEFPSIKCANEQAREFVESRWDMIDGRLSVVSGKKPLSLLRGKIQDSYGLNFGNERLAEGFTADEVPEEVVSALNTATRLEAPALVR